MNKYANEPFTLFISGTEPENYFHIVAKETPNMLISYLYAQRKGKKFIRERIEKCPNLRLIVDSGAHTFLSRQDEYKDKTVEYWENYLEGYVQFARENREQRCCTSSPMLMTKISVAFADWNCRWHSW